MQKGLHTASRQVRRVARRGFTLIEVLVVFALLAIMLTLAAPTFISFQRNSELTSTANSFVAALSAARAEAMKRQVRAFVIPVTGTNWATGWTVFVDVDNNVTAGAMTRGPADILVLQQVGLPSAVTVDTATVTTPFGDGGVAYAMFNGSGFMTLVTGTFPTNGVNAIEFTNGDEARRVIANTTGRLRVCKPADAGCNITDPL